MRGTLRTLIGLALFACLALPPSAGAAVTVGSDLSHAPDGQCGAPNPGDPCSFYTVTKPSGAAETGSPITGVMVSARVRTTGVANTVAVRVLREDMMLANTYLNVAPETMIPVTMDGTLEGHVTEASNLHHPINAGDKLGIGFPLVATFFPLGTDGASACGFRQGAGQEHPPGTTHTYNVGICSFEALVQGTVEPDADRDNFGDETQDQCPTNAAVQTACPTPPGNPASPINPAGNVRKRKCKKKRRGAAAAKRKKCKKKRR